MTRVQIAETGGSGTTVEFDLDTIYNIGFIYGIYRAATTDTKDGYCVIKKSSNNWIICAKNGLTIVTALSYNATTKKLTVTCGSYATIGLVV